jgi:ATP-dependent helicase HrpB
VLVAPPGSGKTTLVPPFLLSSGLVPKGEIVVLQPRRVAARTVAKRLASQLGEPVGQTVGYRVRFDQKTSAKTRIVVVTEGVLVAQIQRDPELSGVGCVVLDELHERSLYADLALALTREVQDALREDLVMVAMSATLDPGPVSVFLGGCPVIESAGRPFEVDVRYLALPDERPVSVRLAEAAVTLVDAGMERDILAFLPGVREIMDTAAKLEGPFGARQRDVAILHGGLSADAQDAVLSPGPRGRIVLATNLAETSLTIENIGAVIDSGLARVMRYEPKLGSGRLETERISRASADQRAGRAGRLGPGVAVRLWTRPQHQAMPAFNDPAIAREELTSFTLELLAWGVADPAAFPLLDRPEPLRIEAALSVLRALGAVNAQGLTDLGRRMRRVPAGPRVAAFLVDAARSGQAREAADWAVTSEMGYATRADGVAIERRVASLFRGPSARQARQLAKRLERAATEAGRGLKQRQRRPLAQLALSGWPDRVGRRREPGSSEFALATGRGARLDGTGDPLDGSEFAVVLELSGGRRGTGSTSLIRMAVAIARDWLVERPLYRAEPVIRWDAKRRRVMAEDVRGYGALVFGRQVTEMSDRAAAEQLLFEVAAADLSAAFGTLSAGEESAVARFCTAGRCYPELGLPTTRDGWLTKALPILCRGSVSFAQLQAGSLARALQEALPWEARAALQTLPERIEVPSGSKIRLEYTVDGPPVLAVKVQELYGSTRTPTVADGRMACLLHLLNPAGRPLQVTSDLVSFWRNTWPEVRSEMRSRYPKHRWPDDPVTAAPSTRTTQKKRR